MKTFLGALTAAMVAATSAGAADTDTAVLTLEGSVAPLAEMTLSGLSGSVSVGQNTSQHQIGSIGVTCNLPVAMTVEGSSANGFNLTDGTYNVPYKLRMLGTTRDSNGTFKGDIDCAAGASSSIQFNPEGYGAQLIGGADLTDTVTLTLRPTI